VEVVVAEVEEGDELDGEQPEERSAPLVMGKRNTMSENAMAEFDATGGSTI
jgi:hypothetical protein